MTGVPWALRTGVALVGLYAAVVVVTGLAPDHAVHPLLDGVGNTTPYRWVRPPWYIGSANVKPEPSRTPVAFENGSSPPVGLNSQDGQVFLNIPGGALAPRPGEHGVRADITPLDPKKLARPPGRLRPDGNAYKFELTYEPSGAPLTAMTSPGNIVLVVPTPADTILYSRDGKAWDAVATQMLGDRRSPLGVATLARMTVGAAFDETGYYLVGTSLPEIVQPDQGKNTTRIVGWIVVDVALLVGAFYVVPVLARKAFGRRPIRTGGGARRGLLRASRPGSGRAGSRSGL